ncbi:serine protease [Kribbella sp. NBC_01484]|uniref:S1 family peptidase n=1 Tax=Kribbella sp. NBC_01484 TaxID=2903579 RepID=UPI002E337EFA|nr:serine protease [Kribbella sp. NBC_01484]
MPRPPRRIPTGTEAHTQLETSTPSDPQPPPRPPWIFGRILAGFIVLLIIVAGGVAAGWWIRSQSARVATPEVIGTTSPEITDVVGRHVLKTAGPAVVRVLGTTCAGTGEGSGALIDGETILTAASAIRQPLSIVIVTPDYRIRRANLLGTSADGVAVLRMVGRLGNTLPLAGTGPDPKADRVLVGYTASAKETMQSIGSIAKPVVLSTVMNTAELGGPVLDKSGQVIGVVVGDNVKNSRIVGVDKLRGYVARGSTAITAELGSCRRSRGPQSPVVPELQVASTPLAAEAQRLLAGYFTLQNRHDFQAVQSLYSEKLARSLDVERDSKGHQTSYFFIPKVTDVTPTETDGAAARVSLNVLFSPRAKGAEGEACRRLDYKYDLVREGGKLVIDDVDPMSPMRGCDAE